MSVTEIRESIDGPAGKIELKYLPAEQPERFLAVVCHPHPLHGGTMDNKVVYTLTRLLSSLGGIVVRFNYRGVGKSTGGYAEGLGESEDLVAVADWLKSRHPELKRLWLAGFSFGAFVSAIKATELDAEQLISIAPAVTRFDFSRQRAPECPWTIVMGDADEVVEPEAVFAWVKTLPEETRLLVLEGAGHYFHGRLIELREKLELLLRDRA